MNKHNQIGAINILLVPFILAVVFFVAAVAFGFWAYNSRQDYKTNSDKKVNAAVIVAKQQESTAKDKQFVEAEKQPLRTYNGPQAYGSIILKYPKTWSVYADDTGTNGATPVDDYFYPAVVPAITNQNAAYALRVQVVADSYADVLNQLSGQIQAGLVTVAPYSAPKVSSIVGVRAEGQVIANKNVSMVILPLRDKTLKIWTEAPQFRGDFDTNILPNISFSP